MIFISKTKIPPVFEHDLKSIEFTFLINYLLLKLFKISLVNKNHIYIHMYLDCRLTLQCKNGYIYEFHLYNILIMNE